ncbi:MAG: PocR ligand-binding domain-containing protein [Acidaminococcaceae bacterium]
MVKYFSTQEWIKFIGKDKLQTFQDVFSQTHNVSMSFFDLNGKPLTVWSQYPLFCTVIQKENLQRCIDENKNHFTSIHEKDKSKIFTCPFGLIGFVCPVYFANEVMAYAYVGGVTYEGSKISQETRERYHLPVISRERLKEISELLEETLNLLDVNLAFLEKNKLLEQKKLKTEDTKRDSRISLREKEIVELVCKGFSNKQIADTLFISERTVKTHVSNILAKLNLHDRMQLLVHYYGGKSGDNDEH